MKAVILCGGQGTRIRDVSEIVPKPMLPIGNRPILWHIMKMLSGHGIKDFVLCLGYKGWVIKDYFLQYRAMTSDLTIEMGNGGQVVYYDEPEEADWRITLVDTTEDAETGARVWNVRQHLEDTERFLLTYGDGIADIDVAALLQVHTESQRVAILTGVRPSGRFGEMEFDGSRVTSFNEKPNALGGYINGGFMLFKTQSAWPYFRAGVDLNLEISCPFISMMGSGNVWIPAASMIF